MVVITDTYYFFIDIFSFVIIIDTKTTTMTMMNNNWQDSVMTKVHRHLIILFCVNYWSEAKASDPKRWLFIYAWTKGWANNRDPGDLRRRRAHNGVAVISLCTIALDTFAHWVRYLQF